MPKTRPTNVNPKTFINQIPDETRRKDAMEIMEMMKKITREPPVMWGSSIIGFDSYQLEYASGGTADWPVAGFSPRKQNLTIYLAPKILLESPELKKLGKCKTGVSCLYINKLADVNIDVLKNLITESYNYSKSKNNK